jgi:hypothetical protein
MTPTATASYSSRPMGWFARAEAWLDDKGKGAWIAAMVLGFIFFWPIGLALVFYITYTNRWSKNMFAKSSCRRSARRHHRHMAVMTPTGNSAFDAYREDTLRRLEEEQQNFESFLERLREAKDKAEFDQFMDERATKAAEERQADA